MNGEEVNDRPLFQEVSAFQAPLAPWTLDQLKGKAKRAADLRLIEPWR
jgi:hypothetical protein